MSKKNFKIQDSIAGKQTSKLRRYQQLVIGSESLIDLFKYEILMLFFSRLPGALGIFLRGMFYPILLGKVGKGVVFGNNVVVRHPKKITIGNNVIIDDNVLIDAKGSGKSSIILEDEVYIGRNSILTCKDGEIILKKRANIGFNCAVFSSSKVVVGKDNLVAAYSYFVGGGSYKLDNIDIFINQQADFDGKGGIITEENVWIGAHVVLLDGTNIGTGTVVAAGAVVSGTIPPYSIAAGIPAKVIKKRLT